MSIHISRRKVFMGVLAVALPLTSVAFLEGTAVAKTPVGTGPVTCSVGGSASFSPALTPTGTSASKELVTVSLTAGHCSGGVPAQTSGSTLTKAIKIKATKTGKTKIAGACSAFASNAKNVTVKTKWTWTGAKPSKTVIVGLELAGNGVGEIGFTSGTFATSGSYSGSGHAAVFFNSAGSEALTACIAGSSTTPVSIATIDSSQSTITVG